MLLRKLRDAVRQSREKLGAEAGTERLKLLCGTWQLVPFCITECPAKAPIPRHKYLTPTFKVLLYPFS